MTHRKSCYSFSPGFSPLPTTFHFSFISGSIYHIIDKGGQSKYDERSIFNSDYVYIGKNGKHHVFKNTLGNWLRTYTDFQLIGKTIQEVKI